MQLISLFRSLLSFVYLYIGEKFSNEAIHACCLLIMHPFCWLIIGLCMDVYIEKRKSRPSSTRRMLPSLSSMRIWCLQWISITWNFENTFAVSLSANQKFEARKYIWIPIKGIAVTRVTSGSGSFDILVLLLFYFQYHIRKQALSTL